MFEIVRFQSKLKSFFDSLQNQFCLGAQFKWKIFLCFCETFLANRQANIHSIRKGINVYLQKAPGLGRSERRTGENGPRKSLSEPGRRTPRGTARLNCNHAFKDLSLSKIPNNTELYKEQRL